MRQLIFIVAYLTLLPLVFISPFVGMLAYKWLEYMPPGQVYWAYLLPDQYSFVLAAATIGAWIFIDRKLVPRPIFLFTLLLLFFIWINVTTYFALAPDFAYVKWERTVKVLAIALILSIMMTSRARIESFLWVMVLSIGFFAISGAAKTVLGGGGGNTVVGAPTTFISDRVAFATYLAALIPLIWYLRRHATLLAGWRWRYMALTAMMVASMVSIIGSFARTGLFAGSAVYACFVLQSRRKFLAVLVGLAMIGAAVAVAPDTWFDRMQTVGEYEQDASSTSRIDAWHWSFDMALEHPIVGGGFRVFVFNIRDPNNPATSWLEAHNLFFETMAEHGFVGFGLFVGLIVGMWLNCGWVIGRTRNIEELAWAGDLARMLRISLAGFVAGGMFMSVGTFNLLYDLIALSIGLRGVAMRALAVHASQPAGTKPLAPAIAGADAPARRAPLWPGTRRANAPKPA